MAIKLFLKIFFSIPVWLLKCLTFQKSIVINNQILDFQTQVFLWLQSSQPNPFDDLDSLNSAKDLRNKIEGSREDLYQLLNSKPQEAIKVTDHLLPSDFGKLKLREYCPDKVLI
ncbi:MAG: hypothetical protein CBD96_002545, partial [Gammaproteobacteria bacterium TMED236]